MELAVTAEVEVEEPINANTLHQWLLLIINIKALLSIEDELEKQSLLFKSVQDILFLASHCEEDTAEGTYWGRGDGTHQQNTTNKELNENAKSSCLINATLHYVTSMLHESQQATPPRYSDSRGKLVTWERNFCIFL